MFQGGPTKRKEVTYFIVDDCCWTENLDPVFFMISSSLDLNDGFEVGSPLQVEPSVVVVWLAD
jgi:hypothetical protein